VTIRPRKHKRKTRSQATRSKKIYRIGRSLKFCGTGITLNYWPVLLAIDRWGEFTSLLTMLYWLLQCGLIVRRKSRTRYILHQTMNASCCFLNNFFILCNFQPKFKLQLYGIQCPSYVITCSPIWYFCEWTWKSGSLVMEKRFCITVLIRETLNVKIMLDMLKINIENTTRAKALIEFCLSHRDVAHVLIFCIPQCTDNGKSLHIQRVNFTT